MDTIWWNKIPNAAQFIQRISDTVNEGNSIILQLPETIPWYGSLRAELEEDLRKQNSLGGLRFLNSENINDPGEYLFRNNCKSEIRAEYRPSIGYARFLAEHEEIVLHEDIYWICIDSDKNLELWIAFVEAYYSKISRGKSKCRFIFETRTHEVLNDRKRIKVISYNDSIEHYDNVLFNMLVASSTNGNEIYKRYLAEAVSLMFPSDVEFAAKCISNGKLFLSDAKSTIESIANNCVRSDGSPFDLDITDDVINERLWEAQIKIIFPIIEHYRNHIVQKYHDEISSALPITTNYGDTITSAADVELGPITSLVAGGKVNMTSADYQKVVKYKDARNSLAHFSLLTQQEVDYIIS